MQADVLFRYVLSGTVSEVTEFSAATLFKNPQSPKMKHCLSSHFIDILLSVKFAVFTEVPN